MNRKCYTALFFMLSAFTLAAQTGVLWGTTLEGGTGGTITNHGNGVIFSFDLYTNSLTVQHNFSDSDCYPVNALIRGNNGLLYGVTSSTKTGPDTGSIYSFDRSTGTTKKLYGFGGTNAAAQRDGILPQSALLTASDGFLYGTTTNGGALGGGTIYKFDIASGRETVVYNFYTHSGTPSAATLMQGNNGLIYGTTLAGGVNQNGDVFSFDPLSDSLTRVVDSIWHVGFNGGAPSSGVIQVNDSLLYGTSYGNPAFHVGIIYRINLLTGEFTDVYDFYGGSVDGSDSRSTLLQANDGLLYGMTVLGGANGGYGTIYSYNIYTGHETMLHSFGSDTDGKQPLGSLIQASNGLLYGTTLHGGAYGAGTIFSYDIESATEKVVYSFDTIHGAGPESALLEIVDSPSSIRNLSSQSQLQIYPNPSTDQLFIKTEGIQPQTITIYDVDGRKISTQPFALQININRLNSGVYFIEVNSNEGVARKRFVKM